MWYIEERKNRYLLYVLLDAIFGSFGENDKLKQAQQLLNEVKPRPLVEKNSGFCLIFQGL